MRVLKTPAPELSPFLTAEWRYLAMLNYEVDPGILAPYIPRGTELDSWKGRTYVSLVGFLFQNTKVLGLSIPFHRNFEEVNLRFYVRREFKNEVRRGVVFIREVVPRKAITFVANRCYHENYVTLPMSHAICFSKDAPSQVTDIEYRWGVRSKENYVRLTTEGAAADLLPDSEEEFITEHFWGYSRQRSGTTLEYHVSHPSWRVWQAKEASFCGTDSALYGERFTQILNGKPVSAFLAEGSAITVYKGVLIS